MWEQVGTRLFAFADSSTWWIADWLAYGHSTFRDRYEEAVKRTSLSYQTLRNYTWVARAFPLPRRRQTLSFSHHLEVVALEQPEQDYWLRRAEELSWSRNRLRAEVRGSLLARGEAEQPGSGSRVDADGDDVEGAAVSVPAIVGADSTSDGLILRLQISAEDLERLERAADSDSTPLEIWAAEILRRAASRQ